MTAPEHRKGIEHPRPVGRNLGEKMMAKSKKKKEVQQDLVANMRTWQKVENSSVASTGRVIEKTGNPIVRLAA